MNRSCPCPRCPAASRWARLCDAVVERNWAGVELGVFLAAERGTGLSHTLAISAFALSMYFVYRSFYGMRIESESAVRV